MDIRKALTDALEVLSWSMYNQGPSVGRNLQQAVVQLEDGGCIEDRLLTDAEVREIRRKEQFTRDALAEVYRLQFEKHMQTCVICKSDRSRMCYYGKVLSEAFDIEARVKKQ